MKRFFALTLVALALFLLPNYATHAQSGHNDSNVVQVINISVVPSCGSPANVQTHADTRFTLAIAGVASYTAPTSPAGLQSPAAVLTAAQQAMDASLAQGIATNAPYACVNYHWVVKVMVDNTAIIVQQRTVSGQWGVYFPTS